MRLVVMGTTSFAVPTLRALLHVGHEVVAVYTQPPRAKGRGHKVSRTAMHEAAAALGLNVQCPATLKTEEAQRALADLRVDLGVVGAYGLLLPQQILDTPKLGCINLHASALPRWRGAAPIQRAIMAGDENTGLTIFQMEAGLDTGPILGMEVVPIERQETGPSLEAKLSHKAAEMAPSIVSGLQAGTVEARSQPKDGVTYAHKITRSDGELAFQDPAQVIERRIRALQPWPGCWGKFNGTRVNLLEGHVVDDVGQPGEIVGLPLVIACGEKALAVTRVQREGRKGMTSDELQRGFTMPQGSFFS